MINLKYQPTPRQRRARYRFDVDADTERTSGILARKA
jgi:hypothetical protein